MHPCSQPMEQSRSTVGRAAAFWLESATLLFLAAFLAFSYLTGRLRFFLAPRYVWLPLAAAGVLLAMWAALVWAYLRGRRRATVTPACGCQSSGFRPVSAAACTVLLVAPMVFALAVNPTGYSAEGVRKRRAPLPPRNARLQQAIDWVFGLQTTHGQSSPDGVTLPKNPSLIELLDAVAAVRREDIEGQFVTLVGQCDLPDGPDSERFDLYRLVVTCCIADATSVSVEIARPSEVSLDPGQWIRVGGIIKFDSSYDAALPVVHAKIISKIPQPNKPYL